MEVGVGLGEGGGGGGGSVCGGEHRPGVLVPFGAAAAVEGGPAHPEPGIVVFGGEDPRDGGIQLQLDRGVVGPGTVDQIPDIRVFDVRRVLRGYRGLESGYQEHMPGPPLRQRYRRLH